METDTAVMVRIGELWLKSEPVKKQFMISLLRNIRSALDAAGISYEIEEYRGRVLIFGDAEKIAGIISRIFGVVDVSICTVTDNTPEGLGRAASEVAAKKLRPGMRFAVRARRQHVHGFTSQELARVVADAVWEKVPEFVVDLDDPEYEIFVEAREYGGLVYDERISGQGGLPLGTAGRAVVLLSAGIDSPVAAWLMMRRGVVMSAVYMDGGKFSGAATRELALDNARILSTWCVGRSIPVWVVNMEPFFEAVQERCDTHYMCIYCKRFMMQVADVIAKREKRDAIVSGENLGQVASQTLQNLGVIASSVTTPVLRPILTFDKEETVSIARKIGTFHENPGDTNCRAVPKKPATRSVLEKISLEERKLSLDELIQTAADTAELWIAKDGMVVKKAV